MEDLTKQQIVLVTLLVSFVTSIATGIVTVSLMEQAPVGVTQTINQVVERTIERVVTEPAAGQKANAGTSVIKETIVVTTEDQAIKAVEKNNKTVVRIKTRYPGELTSTFTGIGIIVNAEGYILSDKASLAYGGKYTALYPDGSEYPITPIESKNTRQYEVVLFKPVLQEGSAETFTPVTFANTASLKLGQSVIAISGTDAPLVTMGIIQSLHDQPIGTSTEKMLEYITTTIDPKISAGSPLMNLTGDIVGLKITLNEYSSSGVYLPSSKLKEYIDLVTSTLKPQQ